MSDGLPGEPPDVRASDAERERIAEVLRDALEEGRLDLDEFQGRLDRTYEARTRGELAPLVRDLPRRAESDDGAFEDDGASGGGLPAVAGAEGPDGAGFPALPPRKRRPWAERIGGAATSRWGAGLMGGFGRRGEWTAPRVFTAIALMGGGELDLREARFEERDIVVRCFAVMGGVGIVVPPGVGVEVRGVAVMGGFDSSATGPAEPGAPRVIVTGFSLMGGVAVERKLPRDDKRQLRAERRELERRRRLEKPESKRPKPTKPEPKRRRDEDERD